MPNTVNRGYPYPSGGDQAAVHSDIQGALEWVDADVQNLSDQVGQRVTGIGASTLWVGTYDEWDALPNHDPNTVYVIRGGPQSVPGQRWGLGTPTFTAHESGTMSWVTPTLPPLDLEDWGYMVIAMASSGSSSWTCPDGWTQIAEHTDVLADAPSFGVRAMGVFKAPAGTSGGQFYVNGGGQGRMVAAAFPIRLQPTNEGMVLADWPFLSETFTMPGQQFLNPAVPITIAHSNRSALAGSILPTLSGADYNAPSPTTIVAGMGLSVMHLIIGESPVVYAPESSHTVSDDLDQYSTAYRIGIGSM